MSARYLVLRCSLSAPAWGRLRQGVSGRIVLPRVWQWDVSRTISAPVFWLRPLPGLSRTGSPSKNSAASRPAQPDVSHAI
ncbi:hypothetical protein NDU88_007626 [Pleurodeles waltl]|uniref:Uncharacterized protein n=1 Tax=Pleurodeles waltl TaxID=8319 RepID=A0AAV7N2J9_PLEWA|nr:hypothetical protein NDU88_007626 [Pleurodeles waltl]